MSAFVALLRRELGVYFVSPMAYLILTALLSLSGIAFVNGIGAAAQGRLPVDYRMTVATIAYVVILSSPLVTMRLIAEEKSRGTLEITLTAPVSDAAFVLAKFVSTLVLLGWMVALTLGYLVIISRYGTVDAGAAACGYLGVLLSGAVMYSIGLFVSSLCTSQVTAGIVTFALAFVLLLVETLGAQLPPDSAWREVLGWVDITRNFGDFMKGVVDRGRLVYLLSVTGFFLFLTVRVVESRRWR